MMDMQLINDFNTLLNYETHPCVSLYLPTERDSSEYQTNRLRLKNLLRSAENQLPLDEAPQLKPQFDRANALLEHEGFWHHQNEGMAVFLSQDNFLCYRLPKNFEEAVYIGPRFHINPLIPLINDNKSFYVIAISLNTIRLFHCTRYQINPIELGDIPDSLSEALQLEESENHMQFHTQSSPGNTGQGAIFHGQGGLDDKHKDRVYRFIQTVEKEITGKLQSRNEPLVFAGVEFLFAMYKQANTYPHLHEADHVKGSMEETKALDLLPQAWQIIQPHFQADFDKISDRFHALKQKKKASDHLNEIIPASVYKRVGTLCVVLDRHQWGGFDSANDRVGVQSENNPGNEDLLNFAAVHTLRNGGNVYAAEQNQMPTQSPIGAVFRY